MPTQTRQAQTTPVSGAWVDFYASRLNALDGYPASLGYNDGAFTYGRLASFGFAIPADATITDIWVSGYGRMAGPIVYTTVLSLDADGCVSASMTNQTSYAWFHGHTTSGFPTPAQLNDPSWGVSVVVTGPHVQYLDYVHVSVTYAYPPPVTTTAVTAIAAHEATSGGTVTDDGGSTVTERGVCWSAGGVPTIASSKTSDGTGTGAFTSAITGLADGITYYLRAYATNAYGTAYGSQIAFTTLTAGPPSVQTTPPSAIAGTSAESGGVVTSEGGLSVTARGVCRNTTGAPTTGNIHTDDGNGLGTFTSSLTGLTSGILYYVRAYATNAHSTGYGQQYSFLACDPPTVETVVAHDIRAVSAASGGNVTSDGSSPVTERGVCWGTSPRPTLAGAHSSDGTGTGEYDSVCTGLATSTHYYVCAYATNARGTTYDDADSEFTTLAQSVSTVPVSGVTETTAESGGEVTGAIPAVTSRGVCWSSSPGPTTADPKTVDGAGSGAFASSVTGLSAEVPYYLRAYAVAGGITLYGEEIAFATSPHLRCGLGRGTAWARALTEDEVLADVSAGMEYFGRSLAKGTAVVSGKVRTRSGALINATHVKAGWWVQHVEWVPDPAEPPPPLYITGHSIDVAAGKNALTIGVDWMEREIGVRMGELLAMPATQGPEVPSAHEYVPDAVTPDVPKDPSEPWLPEEAADPYVPVELGLEDYPTIRDPEPVAEPDPGGGYDSPSEPGDSNKEPGEPGTWKAAPKGPYPTTTPPAGYEWEFAGWAWVDGTGVVHRTMVQTPGYTHQGWVAHPIGDATPLW